MTIRNEQQIIEQMKSYKRIVGRIRILERTPIGYGMYLDAVDEDDKLQALHRRLRGMPTYMYLSKREQQLETTAHAYMTDYPSGTRAQLQAVPRKGSDAEDDKLLRELRAKIQKVIEARGGHVDDYDAVIERMTELDELRHQKEQIDRALETLKEYNPHLAELLRLRYVQGLQVGEVAAQLGIVRRTFDRWNRKAIEEISNLWCMS